MNLAYIPLACGSMGGLVYVLIIDAVLWVVAAILLVVNLMLTFNLKRQDQLLRHGSFLLFCIVAGAVPFGVSAMLDRYLVFAVLYVTIVPLLVICHFLFLLAIRSDERRKLRLK